MDSELVQLQRDLVTMGIVSGLEEISVRSLVLTYRRRALLVHPDKGGSEADFKELADSYKSLLRYVRRRKVGEDDMGKVTAEDQDDMKTAEFFNKNNFTQVNTKCVTVKLEDSKGEAWSRALEAKFGPGKILHGQSGIQFKEGLLSFTLYQPKTRKKCVKIHIQSCTVEERLRFVSTKIAKLYEEVRECSGGENFHACTLCDKVFNSVKHLTIHKINHSDRIIHSLARKGTHRIKFKPELSDVIPENTVDKKRLTLLKVTAETEQYDKCSFVCMTCEKEFKTENSLERHEELEHNFNKNNASKMVLPPPSLPLTLPNPAPTPSTHTPPSHTLTTAPTPMEIAQQLLTGGQSPTPSLQVEGHQQLARGLSPSPTPSLQVEGNQQLARGLSPTPSLQASLHHTPPPMKKMQPLTSIEPPSPWMKEVAPPVEPEAPQLLPLWQGEVNIEEWEGTLSKTAPELWQCLKEALPDKEVKKPEYHPTLYPTVTVENADVIEVDENEEIVIGVKTNLAVETEPLKVGKKRINAVKPSSETIAACAHEDVDEDNIEETFDCKHCGYRSANLSDFWNHLTVVHAGLTDMKTKVDFFIYNLVEDSMDIKSKLVAALQTINFIVEDNYFLSNQVEECFKTIMSVATKLEASLQVVETKKPTGEPAPRDQMEEIKEPTQRERMAETKKSTPREQMQSPEGVEAAESESSEFNVLWTGTSLSDQHLDQMKVGIRTGTKVIKMKAFTIARKDGKKEPQLNVEELVAEYLEKVKTDIVVVEAGVNEISNLDLNKEPQELRNEVKIKMEHLVHLASTWVVMYPGLRVVLLDRVSRIDSTARARLALEADHAMRMAWQQSGCPANIIIESLNLQVQSRRAEEEVFGRLRDRGCDGIHLRGEKGSKEFTYRGYKLLSRVLKSGEQVSNRRKEDETERLRTEEDQKRRAVEEMEAGRSRKIELERKANEKKRIDLKRKEEEERQNAEIQNYEERKIMERRRRAYERRKEDEWRRAEEWTKAEELRKTEEHRRIKESRRNEERWKDERLRVTEEEKQRRIRLLKQRDEESKRRIKESLGRKEELRKKDEHRAEQSRKSDEGQQGVYDYVMRRVAREARHTRQEKEEKEKLSDFEKRKLDREARHVEQKERRGQEYGRSEQRAWTRRQVESSGVWGRRPAENRVERGRRPAEGRVERGRSPVENRVERGRRPVENRVGRGRRPAEGRVERGRGPAESRVETGRRPAEDRFERGQRQAEGREERGQGGERRSMEANGRGRECCRPRGGVDRKQQEEDRRACRAGFCRDQYPPLPAAGNGRRATTGRWTRA